MKGQVDSNVAAQGNYAALLCDLRNWCADKYIHGPLEAAFSSLPGVHQFDAGVCNGGWSLRLCDFYFLFCFFFR